MCRLLWHLHVVPKILGFPQSVPTTQQSLKSETRSSSARLLISWLPDYHPACCIACLHALQKSNTVGTNANGSVVQSSTQGCLPACPPTSEPSPEGSQALIFIFAILHRTLRIRLFPHPIGPQMPVPMSHEPSMILLYFSLTALILLKLSSVFTC